MRTLHGRQIHCVEKIGKCSLVRCYIVRQVVPLYLPDVPAPRLTLSILDVCRRYFHISGQPTGNMKAIRPRLEIPCVLECWYYADVALKISRRGRYLPYPLFSLGDLLHVAGEQARRNICLVGDGASKEQAQAPAAFFRSAVQHPGVKPQRADQRAQTIRCQSG